VLKQLTHTQERKMGRYLNDSAIMRDGLRDKEEFLETFGAKISIQEFKKIVLTEESKDIPVVLIDNGFFTAALVADRQSEIDYVNSYDDVRPKTYYLVSKSDLKEELVC
jgi:hypothetical protein